MNGLRSEISVFSFVDFSVYFGCVGYVSMILMSVVWVLCKGEEKLNL